MLELVGLEWNKGRRERDSARAEQGAGGARRTEENAGGARGAEEDSGGAREN